MIELKQEKKLTNEILKYIPTGIMIVDDVVIRFSNPTVNDTITKNKVDDINFKEIDIMKKKYESLLSNEFDNMTLYIHELKNNEEYFNVSIIPFKKEMEHNKYSKMLVFEDVSYEIEIRNKF